MKKLTKEESYQKKLATMMNALHEALKAWKDGERWTVYVSEGNKKMGSVPSVSLLPLITCNKSCRATCGHDGCYAVKMAMFRGNVRKSWARNTVLLMLDPAGFYDQLYGWLLIHKPDSFRFNVAGDFANLNYFDIAVGMAESFPETHFLAFTREYEKVASYIDYVGELPDNMHFVLSSWEGLKTYNPYDLPESVVLEPGSPIPEGVKLCGGNCFECKCHGVGCWSLKQGEKIGFYKH